MEQPMNIEEATAVLAEIDAVVPESDPAYDEDMQQHRRDARDRLMYRAADACAFLLKELDAVHAKLGALGAAGDSEVARTAELRLRQLHRVAELATPLSMLGTGGGRDEIADECATLLIHLGFGLSRAP